MYTKLLVSVVLSIVSSQAILGQFDLFIRDTTPIDTQHYIHYYPFHEGVQMIKIDHEKLFTDQVHASDPLNSYAMSSAPPSYYILMNHQYIYPTYLFRDTLGQIVKGFPGETISYRKLAYPLLSVHASKSQIRPHPEYGPPVIETYYDREPKSFGPGIYCIQDSSGKLGLMDTLGKIMVQPQYDLIRSRSSIYLIRKDELWGLMNANFSVIVHPQFNSIKQIKDKGNDFLVEKKKCYGVVNSEGEEMAALKYHFIESLKGKPELYSFRTKKGIGVMDSAFRIIQPAQYQHIQNMGSVYRVIMPDKQHYGLLDANGSIIFPPIFNEIQRMGAAKFKARIYNQDSAKNMFGILDQFGKVILPVEYDAIYWMRQKKHFIVRKGKDRFFLDREGNRIEDQRN